jgi:hypothetical protein
MGDEQACGSSDFYAQPVAAKAAAHNQQSDSSGSDSRGSGLLLGPSNRPTRHTTSPQSYSQPPTLEKGERSAHLALDTTSSFFSNSRSALDLRDSDDEALIACPVLSRQSSEPRPFVHPRTAQQTCGRAKCPLGYGQHRFAPSSPSRREPGPVKSPTLHTVTKRNATHSLPATPPRQPAKDQERCPI